MATQEPWTQRLRNHCLTRGIPEPTYQDISDRRGGRTAWSTMVSVNGISYSAAFWYDGLYVGQAKEDAAEVAYKAMTGATNTPQAAHPTGHYRGQHAVS